jgi:hypothetical protein
MTLATLVFLALTAGCRPPWSMRQSPVAPLESLSIKDLEGLWEGVQCGVCFLDIQKNGQGFLVLTSKADTFVVYEIVTVYFADGPFFLSLQKQGEKDELLNLEGMLVGENVLLMDGVDRDSKQSVYFLRDSAVFDIGRRSEESRGRSQGPLIKAFNRKEEKNDNMHRMQAHNPSRRGARAG